MSAKWLELLKQVAPRVARVAVVRNSANPFEVAQFGAIQAVAPSLGVELTPIIGRDPVDIERDITVFARGRNGGLIVTGAGHTTNSTRYDHRRRRAAPAAGGLSFPRLRC